MPFESTNRGHKNIGIIGFPFNKGQPRGGTELGPKALREADIIQRLKDLGHTVKDHGDLDIQEVTNDPIIGKVKNSRNVGQATEQLADAVENIVKNDGVCLVLGGDHSLGIGSIAGQARHQKDLIVVWVDAHADLNTPLTSSSGNIHGMPLSFLLHETRPFLPNLPAFEWCKPCISAKDLVYIGLRDIDPGERAFIDKFGIAAYSMQEVEKYGIQGVMDRALHGLDPSGTRPIHLSFDIDSMDPAFAPATGTPVPGGLTLRESLYLAQEIADTGRLACLDMAEVNPALSNAEGQKLTAKMGVEVIAHLFGAQRIGNVPKGYSLPRP